MLAQCFRRVLSRSASKIILNTIIKRSYQLNCNPRCKHKIVNATYSSANIMKLNNNFSTSPQIDTDEVVQVTYIDRDEETHVIKGRVGDNVMYLAHKHDLDIEGACEASLACCTCHVYVENDFYNKLPEPEEEEEDMLDLAPFLQENSRLSCQIILDKDMDGIVVRLPTATRNFYVDGHKPHHH